MKIKLQKVFIVCLVTLAVFSPGLMVFSIIWQRHLEFIKTQSITQNLNFDNYQHYNASDDSSPGIIDLFQQPNIVIFFQWLLFGVPISMGIMLFLYERYLIRRATTHQQNVDMLERLYQQDIKR
jgi:ABC-type phosphate transport system permease subunit